MVECAEELVGQREGRKLMQTGLPKKTVVGRALLASTLRREVYWLRGRGKRTCTRRRGEGTGVRCIGVGRGQSRSTASVVSAEVPVTMASVVRAISAMEHALTKEFRVTLAGSMTPASTRSSMVSVIAL